MESPAGSSSNPQTAWSEIIRSEISDHLGRADIGQGLDQDNSVVWSGKGGSEHHHHLDLYVFFLTDLALVCWLNDRLSLG